jgi:hypothetical protein
MRRLPTMLASASAAALSALAITVAVPAIADNAGEAKHVEDLPACLRAHGLSGVPDGPGLKPWLGARLDRGDSVTERALAACGPKKTTDVVIEQAGPSEQELRSCLTDHGVALPAGDGRVLKNWLLEHGDDAANRDAMKACHFAPPKKVTDAAPCAAPKHVATRAGKAAGAGAE